MKAPREALTLSGALTAALAASACCIGPLVLAALGIGGAAFAVALEPYRPYLIGLTIVLLGTAFYGVYRAPADPLCEPGGTCEAGRRRTGLKMLLWLASLLIVAALTFPYYASHLF